MLAGTFAGVTGIRCERKAIIFMTFKNVDTPMSNGYIFMSYRRDDSAGFTRAIYAQFVKRFTKEHIFMDVDAIKPGLPFDEVIRQAVGRCEILLVMIGKRWMEHLTGVGPLINDERDFVRLEIELALA